LKPKQTTTFKKKKNKENGCFVCGSDEHWASACPHRKFKQETKSANIVVSEAEGGTFGYENYLPTVLSVCHSLEWWIDTGANINACANAYLFSSYQVGETGALLMRNRSHTRVLGFGTIILKFTWGKMALLKNVQHAPSIKNLVSGSKLLMVIKLSSRLINVYYQSMEHLLVKVMIAEPCSTYLCMIMCVIRL
jgi:hypothetical protein